MASYVSNPEDLALHGARVLGFAPASRIAARFRLDASVVNEALLDFEVTPTGDGMNEFCGRWLH